MNTPFTPLSIPSRIVVVRREFSWAAGFTGQIIVSARARALGVHRIWCENFNAGTNAASTTSWKAGRISAGVHTDNYFSAEAAIPASVPIGTQVDMVLLQNRLAAGESLTFTATALANAPTVGTLFVEFGDPSQDA